MSDDRIEDALRGGIARLDPVGPCPDPERLALFAEGRLGGPERPSCVAHVADCERCQAWLAAHVAADETAPVPRPEPGIVRGWSLNWRWVAPLATAAVVVVAVGLRRPVESDPRPRLLEAERPTAQVPARESAALADATLAEVESLDEPLAQTPRARAASPSQDEVTAAAARVTDARASAAPAAGAVAVESLAAPPATAPPPAGPRSALPRESAEFAEARQEPPADGVRFRGDAGARAAGAAELEVAGTAVRWRAGLDGVLERSDDEGLDWRTARPADGTSWVTGSAPSSLVCWWLGADGELVRTGDGGETWAAPTPPAGVRLVGVQAEDAETAVLVDAAGGRWSTADGGQSWREGGAPDADGRD